MSIRKNTWNLDGHYDLTKDEQNTYFNQPELYSWGQASSGRSALNDTVERSSPTQIPGAGWDKIFRSGNSNNSNAGLKTDGTLWVWGHNGQGQLGTNDIIPRSSPVQIPGTQWKDYTSQDDRSIATKTDGTLWVWGNDFEGSLGLGSNTGPDRSSPTQIPGTSWNTVGFAIYGAFVTKTNGELWAWGRNGSGQLGINSASYRSSPVKLPGTEWVHAESNNVSFGIKSDGTLWGWGQSNNGQLGQNSTVRYSSPRQVPGTWSDFKVGGYSTLGIKTDGTLWMWGYNSGGRLGQNGGAPNYSSPRQIPGTQWSTAEYGDAHVLATKTDGTTWVWGHNGYGNFGLNDQVQRSSPIQLPGTWTKLEANNYTSFGFK